MMQPPLDSASEPASAAAASPAASSSSTSDPSSLVARLSSSDGIMESDVLSTLSSYLQSGGSPRTAIRLLSDNYRGYADSVNLLERWLSLLDDDAQQQQQPADVSYATEAFQQLVVDAFDAAEADSVFATLDAMPAWLAELLAIDGWRGVMQRLHAQHPHSLFVSFAMRAMQAGGEQAGTGQAETSMADVRSRVEQAMRELIAAVQSNSSTVHSQVAALASVTAQSECAYLYTQFLLQSISLDAGVAALLARRVSEDVSIFASTAASAASSNTMLDFVLLHSPRHADVSTALLPFYRSLADCTAADLSLPLVSSSLPSLTSGDVGKLYAAYSSASPPPVALLHVAPLLCSLVHMLLDGMRGEQERQHVVRLLCSAASPSSAADTQPSSLSHSLTLLTGMLINKSWLLSAPSVLRQLRTAVHSPLLSTVALYFIHTQLTSAAYFDSPSAASFTPQLLSVVGELVSACPLLHPALFATLTASFGLPALAGVLDSLALIAYRKLLVLLLLHLLLEQHAQPVLQWAREQLVSQDHSLVRAFVLGVMGGVADCGKDVSWLHGVLALLCTAEVRAALRQWTGELGEAIRSERWRRLMADKRLGKTDAGRKRLRRMGADAGGDDDADWQPADDTQQARPKRQREETKAVSAAEVQVRVRSFLAPDDSLLDAEGGEVREDVKHFGRLVVGVHARLSSEREKGTLDEQGEQAWSDIEQLFVVLQET